MLRYIKFIFLILISSSAFGQKPIDSLYWRSPVDIPIYLSGNFAELRSNHFHGGIDIKTQGKEGFKLYAVQDGYISRIKVSPSGYGKSIYITHIDGYTSVYAHMREYNIQLDRYVKNMQYQKQNYSVDIFPDKWELTVKKGDIIGLSGDSGSSAGPHLHFEIRDTKTSKPQNGLLLGYDIEDTIQPRMYFLYAYPQENNSTVNNKREKSIFSLNRINGQYKIKGSDTIEVSGSIGFGLKVNEYLNNSRNRCGVYVLNLYVNNELYMQQIYDEFSFAETRYINSLMDYEENVSIKRKLYKLYREPNNNLSIYKHEINRGVVTGNTGEIKNIRVEAIDVSGNKSILEYNVHFIGNTLAFEPENNKIVIPWQDAYIIDTNGFKVKFLKNSFYDTLHMNFSISEKRFPGTFSSVYTLHSETTPVHKYFKLEIPCDSVDSTYHDKLILSQIVKNDYKAVGGLYVDGKLKAKVRSLGEYVVLIDTIAPTIIPLNGIESRNDLAGIDKIQFKIDDEFSGVSNYTGTINGYWVLFEWDSKNRLITYDKDEYFPVDGFCDLELRVVDGRGNESVFRKEFEIFSETDHDIGQ